MPVYWPMLKPSRLSICSIMCLGVRKTMSNLGNKFLSCGAGQATAAAQTQVRWQVVHAPECRPGPCCRSPTEQPGVQVAPDSACIITLEAPGAPQGSLPG